MALPSTFDQKNIALVSKALQDHGIKNKFLLAGILATAGKETGFVLRPEVSYANTSAKRIREVFTSRVADLSDGQIDVLKKNKFDFWEKVYGKDTKIGKKLGNTLTGDGAKYIGRGFNGLTGRANYERYGKLAGVDLLAEPDLLNSPILASKVLALFYIDLLKSGAKSGAMQKSTGVKDYESINSLADGVKVAVLITAGFPTAWQSSAILTEGMNKALSYSKDFYGAIGGGKGVINILLLGFVIGSIWLYVKNS